MCGARAVKDDDNCGITCASTSVMVTLLRLDETSPTRALDGAAIRFRAGSKECLISAKRTRPTRVEIASQVGALGVCESFH